MIIQHKAKETKGNMYLTGIEDFQNSNILVIK